MNTNSLLIEFLTEELPPINLLDNIGNAFAENFSKEIKNFLTTNTKIEIIATPRRFGFVMSEVLHNEPNSEISKKGPPVSSAMVNNQPTRALEGFMRSCGIDDLAKLTNKDGYFYASQKLTGKSLPDILYNAINNSLKKLPIAKNMRWGDNEFSFVRPVHNLMIMYGSTYLNLPNTILGLNSTPYTLGHRVLSKNKIEVTNPNSYFNLLHKYGYVIASFSQRKQFIFDNLTKIANELNLKLNYSEKLLDEVTALTEYPVILHGQFDKEFLEAPQECLILSMEKNQKYFALLNSQNKLNNQFLFVANISSTNPSVIIHGNERVLCARLSDAKFFYDFDKKNKLGFFVERLSHVVYHNKIGSQLQRVSRLQTIASEFAPLLNVPKELAEHTAYLMKADLTTEMVGEFPELQGIMGKYYAIYHDENPIVANAIEKHYYPRFSKDNIPEDNLSIIVALADKLETLIGIWGIGLIPTGDKDPFGLRRMALGVVKILLTHNINLFSLLEITLDSFNRIHLKDNTLTEVYNYILQRLLNYLTDNEQYNFDTKVIQSICATNPSYFNHIISLANTLQKFAKNKNNQILISANKRIENIIKKNQLNTTNTTINPQLFSKSAEGQLYAAIINSSSTIQSNAMNNNWDAYFSELEQFNLLVNNFFDNVMVIDDNQQIRENRIALIDLLYKTLNRHCKLSELSI